MNELLNMMSHVFEIVATWVIVGSITAPIVWGWYCVDKAREERDEWNG